MLLSHYKNNKKFLTRQTSSGNVLNEIDGLRGLAIFMVIYFHTFGFIQHHLPAIINIVPYWLSNIMHNGHNGVPLFFAISSFVLGIPFAKHYIFKDKEVNLKKYFIRRFTRLQPTYFIVLFILGITYWIYNKYSLPTLIESFSLSNIYLHNIVFKTGSLINYVAWSLEVEFQFYLILPILAFIFKLNKKLRRVVLILGIISGSFLNPFFNKLQFISLLNYYHYFLTGLLVLDIYLIPISFMQKKHFTNIIMGIVALSILISQSSYYAIALYLIPFATGVLIVLVLLNPFWKKIFSQKIACKTGTMSYSMYLIHFQIIAIIGIPILKLYNYSNSGILLALSILLLMIIIWFGSAITFLFIEKPFMNPNWYKRKT